MDPGSGQLLGDLAHLLSTQYVPISQIYLRQLYFRHLYLVDKYSDSVSKHPGPPSSLRCFFQSHSEYEPLVAVDSPIMPGTMELEQARTSVVAFGSCTSRKGPHLPATKELGPV